MSSTFTGMECIYVKLVNPTWTLESLQYDVTDSVCVLLWEVVWCGNRWKTTVNKRMSRYRYLQIKKTSDVQQTTKCQTTSGCHISLNRWPSGQITVYIQMFFSPNICFLFKRCHIFFARWLGRCANNLLLHCSEMH